MNEEKEYTREEAKARKKEIAEKEKTKDEEMPELPTTVIDYITLGYRCYNMSDFNGTLLARNLPTICRKNKLDIVVVGNIVYVKETKEYDRKNPYNRPRNL